LWAGGSRQQQQQPPGDWGEAAAYFDPNHVEEMAAVISRLLANPDEYQQRRELGLAQARRFSWQRAAAETLAIYDQILDSRPS
jgi:glycosyltransferase involved in cell wall biosynthesis